MRDNARQALYFGLQRLIGSRTGLYYDELLRLEYADPAHVADIQGERLETLLRMATENIPFYRDRVGRPTGLDAFPILQKEDIRRHYRELMSSELRREYQRPAKAPGYSWVQVQTGGSTGVPTSVVHDRTFRDRGRASRLYSQYLCGFPFGTPYLRLWGSMKEINASKASVGARLTSLLAGEVMLNAFRMRDSDIQRYIDTINSSKTPFLMAYVDAAEAIARYCLRTNTSVRTLKAIMGCAGAIPESTRSVLDRVFGARVHNKYGSRDCADIACECERGGLHIYTPNVFLEIVDDEGIPVPPGGYGRILVTLLENTSFPLIRYEIGDVGSLSSEKCPCGRSFPLMVGIQGRSVEILTGVDGQFVSPTYIRHLIGVVHNRLFFRRFQFVQHKPGLYDLNLEVEDNVPAEDVNAVCANIVRDLNSVLGAGSRVVVHRLREIPLSPSGKFFYTRNLTEHAPTHSLRS